MKFEIKNFCGKREIKKVELEFKRDNFKYFTRPQRTVRQLGHMKIIL